MGLGHREKGRRRNGVEKVMRWKRTRFPGISQRKGDEAEEEIEKYSQVVVTVVSREEKVRTVDLPKSFDEYPTFVMFPFSILLPAQKKDANKASFFLPRPLNHQSKEVEFKKRTVHTAEKGIHTETEIPRSVNSANPTQKVGAPALLHKRRRKRKRKIPAVLYG